MHLNLIFLISFLFFSQDIDLFEDEIVTNSSQHIICRILKIDGRVITYVTLYRGQFKSFTVSVDTLKEVHHNRKNITSIIKRDSIVTYYTIKSKDPAIGKSVDSTLIEENLEGETSSEQVTVVPTEGGFEIPLYLWITGGILLLIPLLYLIIYLVV